MKILPRNGGGYVMEHNGTEAPYEVIKHNDADEWSVIDIEDEYGETPVADLVRKAEAERLALEHFNASQ